MEMLRSGARGEEVKALQGKLLAKGFDPGPIDGAFGPKTESAVRSYQEQKGLQVDGIAGPETFTSLGMMEAPDAEARRSVERHNAPDADPNGDVRAQAKAQAEATQRARDEARAEDERQDARQSVDDAIKQGERDAREPAEAATQPEDVAPKTGGGFRAKIAAMRAKRDRKRNRS